MKYPDHKSWVEFLLAINALSEDHIGCLSADHCVAEESETDVR